MIGLRPSTASLAVRVLVRDLVDDDRLKRIVHMDASIDEVWLKDLENRNWPYQLSRSEFVADYERPSPQYEIVFDEPRPRYVPPPNSNTVTDQREEEHWAIIQNLLAGADNDERVLLFPVPRESSYRGDTSISDSKRTYACLWKVSKHRKGGSSLVAETEDVSEPSLKRLS
jgi:hypothetical protein